MHHTVAILEIKYSSSAGIEQLVNDVLENSNDPINGTDDDHDGYMDNYNGWDFVGTNLFR